MVQYIYTLGAAGERLNIAELNRTVEEIYTYNYAGNRTSKTTSTSDGNFEVVKYLNDNSSLTNVLAELDFDGNVRAYYTIGADLISQERNGRTYTYLYDGHGSVVGLMSESGSITDTYTYDAFGNLLKSTGRTENNYRYCGEQFDSTTGLYYLRARYMDTSTGRFISQDSYAGSVYDPVSLHKYLYANSNPVMYSDPSGYMTKAELDTGMIISSILDAAYQMANSAALATGMKIIAALVTVVDITLFTYIITDYILDNINDIASGSKTSVDVNRGGIVESFPLADEPPVIIEIFPRTDESELSNIESLPLPNNDDVTWTEGISVGTPEPYVESFPLPQETGIKIIYSSYKKPVSGKSGKEAANDVPSWAKGNRPYVNENGKDFAKRLMDQKYGVGNYPTGPGSEYNKIKKWGDRGFV